ncbi:Glycosyl hydrolase family 115 [Amphibacillus marinus]|uniref:Glycosyl hydrolase family 115 n=1 Tax=Amphibacillus marinus TaxID=872970 RepID=A0A1H8PQ93_9BACI|nr:glycosyl hydrolase 115 family protein [Amphibacillus marinus]SEO44172.1 Glycosyl hydrolase family 115 [Amphibacillus marinus]
MMEFVINQDMLKTATTNSGALFYQELGAYSGVNKVAAKVMHDIKLVFGYLPQATGDRTKLAKHAIIYGTVEHSPMLQKLAEQKRIDLATITGKREVFLFQVIEQPFEGVESALIIAGSDKRGAIYGLFHLSEQLGVSPLVNWNSVKPARKEVFSLGTNFIYTSKEPSVRYRGFFINDEWPAFGSWTTHNFGGFNAEMYDHVFELLLRLKGNYLWPAMWSARFSDDGPGLANAELADEYGVVMGASHHEPCLRYGEEYKYLRGADSKYGDAWNFITNRDGIIKFWENGLKRSGQFENVITVGMRGEQDTAIMDKESTLADNIAMLRDVLKTQNQLIREHVNPNLAEVPRMLALYKEVEPFFYGDKDTQGLINSEELENVILMLCDDNHGNLRTLPTEDMRDHQGGYGMYYHFDYHGGPVSYEWINSSYLPKIWEQMTMAYDFGIRDLWLVNVGDIATQEFPLAYFLDLAYDFDKWGTDAINQTDLYTKQWVDQHFANKFSEFDRDKLFDLLTGYTKLAHNRRPETMNVNVYHPVNFKETDQTLEQIDQLLQIAEELYQAIDAEHLSAYVALAYYPAVGNLNLQKLWLLTGKNNAAAKLGKLEANQLAEQVQACLRRDRALVDQYHTIENGKWYGLGLSEHIGFTHWNEDENQNPVLMQTWPANKPRLVVTVDGTEQHTEGSPWHKHTLLLSDFLQPDIEQASVTISSVSDQEAAYQIINETAWLTCSRLSGSLDGKEKTTEVITFTINRAAMNGETEGSIVIKLPTGACTLLVKATQSKFTELPEQTYIETNGYISIEAAHYFAKQNATNAQGDLHQFHVLQGYGKTLSAVKAFPTTEHFTIGKDAPYLDYQFVLSETGTHEVELYMQPSNSVTNANTLFCGVQLNDNDVSIINVLPDGYQVNDHNWGQGVLSNIHKHVIKIQADKGLNTLRIYAVSPGFVLEKLVIYPEANKPAASYLGPPETYYVGK